MFSSDPISPGSTSQSFYLRAFDETTGIPNTTLVFNTAGLAINYRRQGSAVTAITLVTLASIDAAWASGGFIHVGAGYYRLDVPDAALVDGVRDVLIFGTMTAMTLIGPLIPLRTPFDPTNTIPASPAANTYDNTYRALEDGTADVARVTGDVGGNVAGDVAGSVNGDVGGKILGGGGGTITGIGARSDLRQWIGDVPLALSSQRVQTLAGILGPGSIAPLSFQANAITAGAIADGALNDKGNWNIDKTGYDLNANQGTVLIGAVNAANVTGLNGNTRAVDALAGSADTITFDIICAAGSDENTIVYSSTNPVLTSVDQLKGQVLAFRSNTATAGLRNTKARITGGNGTNTLTLDNSQGNALPVAPAVGDVCTAG